MYINHQRMDTEVAREEELVLFILIEEQILKLQEKMSSYVKHKIYLVLN